MSEPLRLSHLQCIILGLIELEPRSGYAVRKAFSSSPLGTLSSSPGAVYPAIRRLLEEEMIVAEHRPHPRSAIQYRASDKGRHYLNGWLSAGIDCASEWRSAERFLIRFAFFESIEAGIAIRQLEHFSRSQSSTEAALLKWLQAHPDAGLYPELAVRHGLMAAEATRRWVEMAKKAILNKERSH